jgi:hypothetical protein
MKVIINWFLFLSFVGAIVVLIWHRKYVGEYLPTLPERGTMTGLQVVIFSLACAFVWVDIMKWGVTKPFTCLKCMTGWFTVIFAFSHHVEFWPLYLPLGLFVGAMFEGIKMRWL